MNKQWRAGLLARFGHDPYPFSVIVEGKDKNGAIKYINKHYPNASIVEIEEDVDDLNMDDLYRDLKGVSPVEERNEDDEEYDSDIPTEIIDYAKEIHRKNPKFSYKEIVMTILDDPQYLKWFKKSYHGNEFDFRQELEEIIREKGVEENKNPKIQQGSQPKASLFLCNECAKTFRANENKCPTCGKEAESVIKEEKLKDEKEEELPVEKPEKDETASAEAKVEGQEKLAPEVKADEGGEVKDKDTKNESKVKESSYRAILTDKQSPSKVISKLKSFGAENVYGNRIQGQEEIHFELDPKNFKGIDSVSNVLASIKKECDAKIVKESNIETDKKIDEQSVGVSEVPSQAKSKDPSKRTIVAKGLEDKYEAERIASSKKGSVVSDDEDPKKYMVVVKESSLKEDNKKIGYYVVNKDEKEVAGPFGLESKAKEKAKSLGGDAEGFTVIYYSKYDVERANESKINEYSNFGQYYESVRDKLEYEAGMDITKDEYSKAIYKYIEQCYEEDLDFDDCAEAVYNTFFEGAVDESKRSFLKSSKKINEAENGYSVEADLDVTFSRHVPDWDIEHPRKVDVYFNIEEEHRSWGIKDISIYVTKPVNVSFVLVKWGENEDERFEKEATVPVDKITYEWDDSAGIFSIPSFQVSVNEKGEVEAAVAYCGYWKP